jgi:2'-5' RNA ligase
MFVAVVPPDDVIEALDEFLESRREADSALRWTDVTQWHVTLAFMADVPERRIEELVERLSRAAGRRVEMMARVTGAGAFPSAAAARVLWLGTPTDPADGLHRLAEGARAAANRSGALVEGGHFRPHLTLARLRNQVDVSRWLRVLDGFASRPWQVDSCRLIQSHLGEGPNKRPRYETVETFPLAARPHV